MTKQILLTYISSTMKIIFCTIIFFTIMLDSQIAGHELLLQENDIRQDNYNKPIVQGVVFFPYLILIIILIDRYFL
jgi:hypothetical protein